MPSANGSPHNGETYGTWADSQRAAWDAVAAWILTHHIGHLIVCRTDRLTTARQRQLLALRERCGTRLTLLWPRPVTPALRTLLEETHTASSTHQSREAPGSRPGLRAVRSKEAGSGARRARFSRAPRARMALDVVHVGQGPLGSQRASRPSGRRTRPKLCASASR